MKRPTRKMRATLENESGYAMLVAILVLVLMSSVAVAMLFTSDNERLASRAMRSGNASLYAAEAGFEEQWALWNDSVATSLNPGDSLDLGQKPLGNGATYRVVIHRLDNGATPIYGLFVEGRGAPRYAGQSQLNVFVEKNVTTSSIITGAVKGMGTTEFQAPFAVSGFDSIPPLWGTKCDSSLVDKPGLVWGTAHNSTGITGNPKVVLDPTINSTNLFTWGSLTYADLVAKATITISSSLFPTVGPQVSGGACVTSDPTNWGDPLNPASPCFNYFPIIHVTSNFTVNSGYGQGILLLEDQAHFGMLPGNFTFYGIIINKGPQIEFHGPNSKIYGGIITTGTIQMDGGQNVQYSTCAVKRAMAAVDVPTTRRLAAHAWNAVLR